MKNRWQRGNSIFTLLVIL